MTDETDWREKYVEARTDVHMKDAEIYWLKGKLQTVIRQRDNCSAAAIALGAGLVFVIIGVVFR